jgi:tRNA(adenine34) deaminase
MLPLVKLLIFISLPVVGCWNLLTFNRQAKVPITTIKSMGEQNDDLVHTYFMNQALEQARKASRKGEVPIGALVVQRTSDGTFQVLSQACNLVETKQDASAHAELLALRQAAKRIKNWRLFNTTLYSTLEPCPMCLAAIQAFRVSSVVYGAPDLRLGAIETHIRLLDFPHPFHTIDSVVPGIQQNTSAELLRDFFRQRRQKTNAANKTPLRTWIGKIFQNKTWWK